MSLLELDLGVRLYVRLLDSQVSGLFAYDDGVGACILLNAGHPRERQAQTAVHELGHLTFHRQTPDVCRFDRQDDSREERYANAFGRAFLTPARTVAIRFQDLTAGAPRFTRRHVILLAHAFGVSREAMVRRLEELGLVKRGTWDWFEANGGITDGQAREALGESAPPGSRDAGRPVSLRLGLLAAEANRQELLSGGQLARLLHLDRVKLREVLDAANADGNGTDDLPSSLDERTAAVVADTSVVISLNATGCADAILRALPNRCMVVEQVSLELQVGRRTSRPDADALAVLIQENLVEAAQLGDAGLVHFAQLVTGSAAETLDDGEAATIAGAIERGAVALVDEHKASRICTERFPGLGIGCTVDVFAQRHVQAALGDSLADAVFSALDRGRMRVPDHHGQWVLNLVGQERAARCRSLPKRFRGA